MPPDLITKRPTTRYFVGFAWRTPWRIGRRINMRQHTKFAAMYGIGKDASSFRVCAT